jgi:hypothetical protein
MSFSLPVEEHLLQVSDRRSAGFVVVGSFFFTGLFQHFKPQPLLYVGPVLT